MNMDELVKELVRKIEGQSPKVVEAIENIGREETTFDAANSVYLDQIAAAQEFLNENHNAGLAPRSAVVTKDAAGTVLWWSASLCTQC